MDSWHGMTSCSVVRTTTYVSCLHVALINVLTLLNIQQHRWLIADYMPTVVTIWLQIYLHSIGSQHEAVRLASGDILEIHHVVYPSCVHHWGPVRIFLANCITEMKNDNNKPPIISKIHKTKYKLKAEQHGPLKR